MIVITVRSATKEGDENVDRKNYECGPHEAFADGIESVGKSEMKKDDGRPHDRNRNGMAQCVEQAKTHAFAPATLHARDIGDGSEVVVVETMTQSEEGAGDESEFKGRRHRHLLGYGCRLLPARRHFLFVEGRHLVFLVIEFVLI